MQTYRNVIVLCLLKIILSAQGILQSQKYELSSSGGKVFSLKPRAQLDLMLRRTEASWSFIIFQAHSKYHNTRVSSSSSYNYSTTNQGDDASVLIKLPYMTQDKFIDFYIMANSTDEYQVDVISTPYNNGAPFPGGCCLTCNLDLDPNIYITYNVSNLKTTLIFSHANVYFKRDEKEVSCDYNKHPNQSPEHYRLEYSLYQAFLDEGNLEQDELFKGLEMMSSPSTIKTFGTKVASMKAPTTPLLEFDTVAGQGIIYNVIVYDPVLKTEAAYSPAHTYGCSFTSSIGNCHSVVSTINKVFAVMGAIVALFMCFFGHRYFKLALFVGGLMNGGFICYIILAETTTLSHTGLMLSSLALGVVGGVLVFVLWWRTEYIRLCLLINGLFLGFLAAGCVMFSPVGDFDVWQSDFDYGMIVISVTLIVPFTLLPWPKMLSIVYTSVVSAYGFIIGIDTFLHTSMSYLVLNIVIRAVETDYSKVIVKRPFQWKDVILSITWVVLAVLGISVQYFMARNRMAFDKSGYLEQQRIRKYYFKKDVDERTPILINTQGYRTNEIC